MRFRHLLIVILFSLGGNVTYGQQWAQTPYEVVGGLSVGELFGDIGGSASASTAFGLKDFSFSALGPGVFVGLRYNVDKKIYVKGVLSSWIMTASDNGSRNENRNFSVTTSITDFAVTAEYYFSEATENRTFSVMSVRGGVRPYGKSYGIYAYLGVGGAYSSVRGNAALLASPRYTGGTSLSPIIPLGIGVKVNIMPLMAFNGEFGTRFAFSDKLDGYTTPWSKANDLYYGVTLGVSYKIIAKRRGSHRWLF